MNIYIYMCVCVCSNIFLYYWQIYGSDTDFRPTGSIFFTDTDVWPTGFLFEYGYSSGLRPEEFCILPPE